MADNLVLAGPAQPPGHGEEVGGGGDQHGGDLGAEGLERGPGQVPEPGADGVGLLADPARAPEELVPLAVVHTAVTQTRLPCTGQQAED